MENTIKEKLKELYQKELKPLINSDTKIVRKLDTPINISLTITKKKLKIETSKGVAVYKAKKDSYKSTIEDNELLAIIDILLRKPTWVINKELNKILIVALSFGTIKAKDLAKVLKESGVLKDGSTIGKTAVGTEEEIISIKFKVYDKEVISLAVVKTNRETGEVLFTDYWYNEEYKERLIDESDEFKLFLATVLIIIQNKELLTKNAKVFKNKEAYWIMEKERDVFIVDKVIVPVEDTQEMLVL